MEARCLLKNRKDLVKALEERLAAKAAYQGAPTFAYKVGPYTVAKDGTLSAETYDEDLIAELTAKGIIEGAGEETGTTAIALPMEVHDGQSLMNIVFRIHSKDELLSKVCGKKGAFRISVTFIQELDAIRPKTKEEFLEALQSCGGNEINTGITFTEEKVVFTGFPFTKDSGVINAYTRLVECISNEAVIKKRIRPERIGLPENEKYSFRNWLVTVGMKGDEYKEARAILLRNLSGHAAFRTKKQMEVQTKKWAEIRKERREQECSKFHVL